MKSIVFSIFLSLNTLAVFSQSNYFGKKINDQQAVAAVQLKEVMGDKEAANLKVAGVVVEVCQAKGCWMTIKLSNGETMRVKFKDYAFFVPKDISAQR